MEILAEIWYNEHIKIYNPLRGTVLCREILCKNRSFCICEKFFLKRPMKITGWLQAKFWQSLRCTELLRSEKVFTMICRCLKNSEWTSARANHQPLNIMLQAENLNCPSWSFLLTQFKAQNKKKKKKIIRQLAKIIQRLMLCLMY